MSTVAVAKKAGEVAQPNSQQSTRETIESIVVAFILAFLFRAFVAEAFVIPTGSMAPTLMGVHKDIVCDICGSQYQASASSEYDSNSGARTPAVAIASTCDVCRGITAYDLRNNANHKSFSGDRILVSKFDYVLSEPQRWDVFVFKYPSAARMNYIKRLVGLPGEQLLINEGDVYVRKSDDAAWEIARKPAHKVMAMRQVVSDTEFRPAILLDKGWPSLWQPWSADANADNAWTVASSSDNWQAQLEKTPSESWLRYYHNFLDETDWDKLQHGQDVSIIAPRTPRLVTDYLAYNTTIYTSSSSIASRDGKLNDKIDSDFRALDFVNERNLPSQSSSGNTNDGLHWVGDLIGEYDVDIESDSGSLLLDLIEFGIHFRCSIDVASGDAVLSARDWTGDLALFGESQTAKSSTKIIGVGSHKITFANIDDQLLLWVDGKAMEFDRPTKFDSNQFRNGSERRPYWTKEDPLDAAPIGIGGQDIKVAVNRAAVFRDIYYIAALSSSFCDYEVNGNVRAYLPDAPNDRRMNDESVISAVYSTPEVWSSTKLFDTRRTTTFKLEEDHFFPMGDNSAASSDARLWAGHNFVERKYLLGKALLVFWPHTWNSPVPFTPNFARMGLIR